MSQQIPTATGDWIGPDREVGLVHLEHSWRLEEAVAQSNPWTVSSPQEMFS
jgi:hypothetical protein